MRMHDFLLPWIPRVGRLLVLLALLLGVPPAASQADWYSPINTNLSEPQPLSQHTAATLPVDMDPFDTDQPSIRLSSTAGAGATTSSSVSGPDILGAERDIVVSIVQPGIGDNGVSAAVSGSAYSYSQDPTVSAAGAIQWDGADNSELLDPTGLGQIDLTLGNSRDAILLQVLFTDVPVDMELDVYTDANNMSSLHFVVPGGIYAPAEIVFPLSSFLPVLGAGADFRDVGAVELKMSSATAPDFVLGGIARTIILTTTKTDALWIDHDHNGVVNPGDTIRYTVLLANLDDLFDAPVNDVVLNDTPDLHTELIAGSVTTTQGTILNGNTPGDTFVQVAVGTIANNDSQTVTFDVRIQDPLPTGVDHIANQGWITADNGTPITIATDDPDTPEIGDSTITPVWAAPDLHMIKTDTGARATTSGMISYSLAYENRGNQDASGTVITETVPAYSTFSTATSTPGWVCSPNTLAGSICTFAVGDLTAGSGNSLDFAVIVTDTLPAGIDAIQNTACFGDDGSNGPDLQPQDNCDSVSTSVDAAPDLRIVKTDGGVTPQPGATLTYTLTISNNGDQGASGIIITETVPAHTRFTAGAGTAGWTCTPDGNAGNFCTFTRGDLAAGDSTEVRFAVTLDDAMPAGLTMIDNTVCVQDDGSNGADSQPQDNCSDTHTPVVAAADLSISKADGGVTVTPGATVLYTLTVANIGNQDATGIMISETVPAPTQINPHTSTSGWTCSPDASSGSSCQFDLGVLAAGTQQIVFFAVDVEPSLAADVHLISNHACVADDGSNGADPQPQNNCADTATPVEAKADLRLVKDDGGVIVEPGTVLVYTLDYENVGDRDAMGVTITETVPAHTTFTPAASSTGWSCTPSTVAGSTCNFNIGGMVAGSSDSIAFAVILDLGLGVDVTHIENNACMADNGANGPDPNPDDNCDSTDTPVTPPTPTPTTIPTATPTSTSTPTPTPTPTATPTPTPPPTPTPTATPSSNYWPMLLIPLPSPTPTPTATPTITPTPPPVVVTEGSPVVVPSLQHPKGIAVNETWHRVYISNHDRNLIHVVDGYLLLPYAAIPVCDQPFGIAANSVTNKVYVACFADTAVAVIDGNTNTVIKSIHVGPEPTYIGVNTRTNRIYVVTHGNNGVVEIDGASDEMTRVAGVGAGAFGLAINENLNRIYVTSRDEGTIWTVDGATMSPLRAQRVWPGGKRDHPYGLGYNPLSNRLYATYTDQGLLTRLAVYEPTADGLIRLRTLTIPDGGNDGPGQVGVNSATNHIFTANSASDSITVIDGNTHRIIDTITYADDPFGIAVDPGWNRIYFGFRAANALWAAADLY